MATLSCPGCGASAQPDASKCEFCGSALVKVACPKCFGELFEGMRFCPHCGTQAVRAEGDPQTTIPCPGCKSRMTPVTLGGVGMYECRECVSTWLAADTFVDLCTTREHRGAVAAAIVSLPAPPPRQTLESVKYRPCPICKRLMNRSNFAKRSGVVVDVCKGHGVWFEHNELRAVLEFIERGGLEKAREAERERDDEERRAVKRDLADLARARGIGVGGVTISRTMYVNVSKDTDATHGILDILHHLLS